MSAVWGYVLGRAQASKTVDRWFWRLPYGPRRVLFRACRLDSGVPPGLVPDVLSRGALFIHVPKTAGVSVQRGLFGRSVVQHQTLRQYELVMSRRQLTPLFKFAFVRNPWDRLVSAWLYLREGGFNRWDRGHAERNLAQFPDFESFVLRRVKRETIENDYWHLRPQVYYLRNGRGRVELDFIGRFENLAQDFQRVAQLLGCSATLGSHNRTRSRQSSGYRDYYTPRSAAAVAAAYRDDIETFGYRF